MFKMLMVDFTHILRDHAGYGLSQWETTLHCNVVSHWLRPYPEWSQILLDYVPCKHVIGSFYGRNTGGYQLNPLRPSDAYMRRWSNHHWFRQWLVDRSAPSHYLNQCWNIVNWTIGNKLQWNSNRNSNIFIQENAFESVVCEMAAILSRPQQYYSDEKVQYNRDKTGPCVHFTRNPVGIISYLGTPAASAHYRSLYLCHFCTTFAQNGSPVWTREVPTWWRSCTEGSGNQRLSTPTDKLIWKHHAEIKCTVYGFVPWASWGLKSPDLDCLFNTRLTTKKTSKRNSPVSQQFYP